MSIDAMKQALEALEGLRDLFYQDTIEALRAAIEAAEKQEPVAIAGGEYPCNVIWYAPVMAGTKLYTRPQPAIPDGWQLVPVEPTGEMLQAAFTYLEDIDFIATGVYKAMLAAAPKQEEMK